METKTENKLGPTRRKSTTKCEKLLAKEERNASLKKVSQILQKSEDERTVEEQQFLTIYSDLVTDLKSRWQKRDELKKRMEEWEEPMEVLQEKALILAKAIAQAEHLVIYTGAGISTAAKIPDYRGTNGIWTRLQQGKEIGNHDLSLAEPTYTHMALSELYRKKILKYIVSQNCDGLHLRSGLPRTALSELHGNMYIEVCKSCKPSREYWRLFDVTENTARYSHKTYRRCYVCNNELTDTIVHFGERGTLQWPLNWKGACSNADKADTILCLGSSLKVLKRYPWLWQMNKPAKKRPNLYIVNLQWTPKDEHAQLKINGNCDVVMKLVMKYLDIEIPQYERKKDPIFFHATNLIEEEYHTTNQPFLKENLEDDITNNEMKNNDDNTKKNNKSDSSVKNSDCFSECFKNCENESKSDNKKSVLNDPKSAKTDIKFESELTDLKPSVLNDSKFGVLSVPDLKFSESTATNLKSSDLKLTDLEFSASNSYLKSSVLKFGDSITTDLKPSDSIATDIKCSDSIETDDLKSGGSIATDIKASDPIGTILKSGDSIATDLKHSVSISIANVLKSSDSIVTDIKASDSIATVLKPSDSIAIPNIKASGSIATNLKSSDSIATASKSDDFIATDLKPSFSIATDIQSNDSFNLSTTQHLEIQNLSTSQNNLLQTSIKNDTIQNSTKTQKLIQQSVEKQNNLTNKTQNLMNNSQNKNLDHAIENRKIHNLKERNQNAPKSEKLLEHQIIDNQKIQNCVSIATTLKSSDISDLKFSDSKNSKSGDPNSTLLKSSDSNSTDFKLSVSKSKSTSNESKFLEFNIGDTKANVLKSSKFVDSNFSEDISYDSKPLDFNSIDSKLNDLEQKLDDSDSNTRKPTSNDSKLVSNPNSKGLHSEAISVMTDDSASRSSNSNPTNLNSNNSKNNELETDSETTISQENELKITKFFVSDLSKSTSTDSKPINSIPEAKVIDFNEKINNLVFDDKFDCSNICVKNEISENKYQIKIEENCVKNELVNSKNDVVEVKNFSERMDFEIFSKIRNIKKEEHDNDSLKKEQLPSIKQESTITNYNPKSSSIKVEAISDVDNKDDNNRPELNCVKKIKSEFAYSENQSKSTNLFNISPKNVSEQTPIEFDHYKQIGRSKTPIENYDDFENLIPISTINNKYSSLSSSQSKSKLDDNNKESGKIKSCFKSVANDIAIEMKHLKVNDIERNFRKDKIFDLNHQNNDGDFNLVLNKTNDGSSTSLVERIDGVKESVTKRFCDRDKILNINNDKSFSSAIDKNKEGFIENVESNRDKIPEKNDEPSNLVIDKTVEGSSKTSSAKLSSEKTEINNRHVESVHYQTEAIDYSKNSNNKNIFLSKNCDIDINTHHNSVKISRLNYSSKNSTLRTNTKNVEKRKTPVNTNIFSIDNILSKTKPEIENLEIQNSTTQSIKNSTKAQKLLQQSIKKHNSINKTQNFKTNCQNNFIEHVTEDRKIQNLITPQNNSFATETKLLEQQIIDHQNIQNFMMMQYYANTVLQNQMLGYVNTSLYPFQTSFLYPGFHSIINPIPYINYDFTQNQTNQNKYQNASTTSKQKLPIVDKHVKNGILEMGANYTTEIRNAFPEIGNTLVRNGLSKTVSTEIGLKSKGSEISANVIPIVKLEGPPSCSFCFQNYQSYSCLYYSKIESKFLNQLYRFSKIKNSNNPLFCICCDYTTEEEISSDDNEDDLKNKKVRKDISESDSDSIKLLENNDDSSNQSDNIDKKVDIKDDKDVKGCKVQPGWFGKGYRKNRRYIGVKNKCKNFT